jgi:hypothetical protein
MVYSSASDRAARPDGLADVFDELDNSVNRENENANVRLGVLLAAVGRRSYGPLLLIIGLFAISPATILPGMTSVAAVITLIVAGQMAIGMKRVWLPRFVLNLKVPRRPFLKFLDRARPTVERIDGDWLRERCAFMTAPPFVNLIALCVIAASLVTFPLSLIPFAPLAPGFAVVLLGLGMTARDGVWLMAGVLATVGAFYIAWPIVF